MRYSTLLLVLILCLSACSGSTDRKHDADQSGEDSIAVLEENMEVVDEQEEQSTFQVLSTMLRDHRFQESKAFIDEHNIDLNAFIEIDRGRLNLNARRLLPEMIHIYCDAQITEFLLAQNADPTLPSITISIPEYSGENIPDGLNIKEDDLTYFKNQGYYSENYPVQAAVSCEDSTSFYMLVHADAKPDEAILMGAIKWSDTKLIKEMIHKGVELKTVPKTNNPAVLKLLVPITDGTRFGEVRGGEGGEMFETDLMMACREGKKALVAFMLETGADPNSCLPTNSKKDEQGYTIGIDENGYYPAVTALSIAKDQYDQNIVLAKRQQNTTTFDERAKNFQTIIELLRSHGAKEIPKCLGP